MSIIVQVKHLSSLSRRSCDVEWRARSLDWKRLYRTLVELSSQPIWWGLLEKFLIYSNIYYFHSWPRSVWSWMKVKVNIINTWCIAVSEAVTMPSLMMMTLRLIVSEESPARDTYGHTLASSIVHFFKVAYDFESNEWSVKKKSTYLATLFLLFSLIPSVTIVIIICLIPSFKM